MRARTRRLNDFCLVIVVLLSGRRHRTHARSAPPERAASTGVPGARAPFAPAVAGGVSAGIGGWARDGAAAEDTRSGGQDSARIMATPVPRTQTNSVAGMTVMT